MQQKPKIKKILQKALEPSFFAVIVLKQNDTFEGFTINNNDLEEVINFLYNLQKKKLNPFFNDGKKA